MLNEARELQSNAVQKLVECILSSENNIVFKAPTGCGKTYMMADMIDRLLVHPDRLKGYDASVDDIIFIVSSLSKSDLAKQNYEKFCLYGEKKFFTNLKPYLINSNVSGEERLFVPTDYNVYFLPRDLYKKNSRLMRGAMEGFLQNLITPVMLGGKGKKIILIKDECHQATNNLDELNNYFDKIINFSATPNLRRGQHPSVEIDENDAVSTKIIKSVSWQDDSETLSDAILKFENVKKDYLKLLGMNPCLIIQISNANRAEEELSEIFNLLKNKPELKWMYIVDKDKECQTNDILGSKNLPVSRWKDYVKENTSTIDIIIFKMVITEGWDIPRACMLYQIRDAQSSQLNEQVIGRIRRNPRLLDYETLSVEQQELALKSWVWGIHNQEDIRQWRSVELQCKNENFLFNITIKTTKLKALTDKKDFNIQNFVENRKAIVAPSSIFDLGQKIRKLDLEIQNTIYNYATDYQKWWKIAENSDALKKEYDNFICDYENSLEIEQENGKDKEVSFPVTSQYLDNANYLGIDNCVWGRKENVNRFSFDSEAERSWAEILKDMSLNCIASQTIQNDLYGSKTIYLWGKNYIPNSDIKFEYYLNGVHSSYPDFIMKDNKGNIHIFEVKSVNKSGDLNIDSEIYEKKIEELKKVYKQASKKTGHIFYIPILNGEMWTIFKYEKGTESCLNDDEFKNSFMMT